MINRPRRQPLRNRRHVVSAPNPLNDMVLRYLVLIAIYLAFMFLVLCDWFNLGVGALAPQWLLAPVFVWSVRQPQLMPAALLFLVGILSDIVIGTPLGVHGTAILAVGAMARFQQRYLQTQNFFAIWADYAALALGCVVIINLFVLLSGPATSGVGSTIVSALLSWGATVLVFPPLALGAHALINLLRRVEG